MNRNILCTVLVVMLALCFAGCSSSSPGIHFGIRVVLSTPPPAQMTENAMAMVAATVTGDSANAGVNWTCSTTGATACGAANFSATHTLSGVATTFTAPAGVEVVTITATSVTDNTKSASANVSVVSGIVVILSTPPPANMVEGTMAPVIATVTGDNANAGVTWSCSTTGATPCGAANFSLTMTLSGMPTTFTAPAGVEMVTVTATSVTDPTQSASANVNVTATSPISGTFSFYMTGQETINTGPNYYALAGTVTIDTNGNVTGGEQDYNDATGITSPEPSGDTITGGSITVDPATGQGTLTLITNNAKVGVGGTETFGVQFVNINHALIIQFDGTTTSSGSMDFQTLPSTVSGGYAFTLSGVDSAMYAPIAAGGVFSVTAGVITSGTVDLNDNGTLTTGTAFTGTVMPADASGRGIINITISGNLLPASLVYYVVGPEAIRIIDVDTTDSAVGSAFGQGAGAFNNASLGSTVFALEDNSFSSQAGAAGMFTTSNTGSSPANFAGVGEDNELFIGVLSPLASPISGTYDIASNGFGSLTVTSGGLGDIHRLGIYLTDPTLNLNDPNNPIGGGGALVNDLDDVLSGMTGALVPQTDTSTASFTGNYAVGMPDYNDFTLVCCLEFDMIAQGSVTAGTLNFTGLVSDPFFTLSGAATSTGDTYTGTPLPDAGNPGRYSMLSSNVTPNPLMSTVNGAMRNYDLVMYQASGGQLFWLNYDTTNTTVFIGPLQQQLALVRNEKGATAPKKTKH
jgi:hypothetical protein